MGLIRICPVHSGTYCDNCLEVDTAYTFDDQDKFLDSDFEPELKYVQGWDTDENGQARTRCWLCPNCRKSALRYQLKRLLIDKCSREGPLLGMGILSIDDACDTTLAGAEYVSDGLGSASEAAQNMLDQQFLMVQGKWESLERVAYKLQEHEEVIRKRIMRTFKGETPREVEMRNRLLAQMMALTEIDDEWVETIQEEYQELWSSHVRRAMELKSRGLVEVEDEDDYELVLDHRVSASLTLYVSQTDIPDAEETPIRSHNPLCPFAHPAWILGISGRRDCSIGHSFRSAHSRFRRDVGKDC